MIDSSILDSIFMLTIKIDILVEVNRYLLRMFSLIQFQRATIYRPSSTHRASEYQVINKLVNFSWNT